MKSARAFWISEPGRGEIRTEPLPGIGSGDVSIHSMYGAVSRGTEVLVYRGRAPAGDTARLKSPFQAGAFPTPVKFGNCVVGRIDDGPENMIGQIVFCAHPHQTRCVVPVDAIRRIPDFVPASRAVLAGDMDAAINVVWDAKITAGSRVSVVGGGAFGCLIGYVARRFPGVSVEIVDIDPGKMEIVDALGLEFKTPGEAQGDRGVAIHASGTPEGLAVAVELVRPEGLVVDASWYGDRPPTLGRGFQGKNLRIIASGGGGVSAETRAWASKADRFAIALSLLQDPLLEVLFTSDIGFEDLPVAMQALAEPGGGVFCTRVTYPY